MPGGSTETPRWPVSLGPSPHMLCSFCSSGAAVEGYLTQHPTCRVGRVSGGIGRLQQPCGGKQGRRLCSDPRATSELQSDLGPLADRPRSGLHCTSQLVLLPQPSRVYDMGVSEDL